MPVPFARFSLRDAGEWPFSISVSIEKPSICKGFGNPAGMLALARNREHGARRFLAPGGAKGVGVGGTGTGAGSASGSAESPTHATERAEDA